MAAKDLANTQEQIDAVLALSEGVIPGTAKASKAVILDAQKNVNNMLINSVSPTEGLKVWGTLYTADGETPQELAAATEEDLVVESSEGNESGITVDEANNKFTVITTGVYFVSAQFSMVSDVNNTTFQFHIAVDGTPRYLGAHRKIATGADVGSCSFAGMCSLTAGEDVTIDIEADKNVNITVSDMQFSIMR